MREVEISNFNNKNINKNFLWETKENNCPCWFCMELKDKKKRMQRQNLLLPVFIGFEQ
jgi:hypothetical protein